MRRVPAARAPAYCPAVSTPADPDARRALASLFAFWSDAGVNVTYEDAPVDRLAEGRRRLQAPRPAPRPPALTAEPQRQGTLGPGLSPDLASAVGDAQQMAAGAETLEALEAAISAYEGCALKHSGATRAVFARGVPGAPVMIIGEGPGGEEDARGQPFVGRAGKLLDRMVAAAGLEGQVFITNTVFWRPPGNRTPSAQEQAACAPFLERAIVLARPQVLLLVGAASAKSVLRRNEGILSLRGRWFEWHAEHTEMTLPALPTLHPAFLLRQPQAKKKAWMDFLSLTERLANL